MKKKSKGIKRIIQIAPLLMLAVMAVVYFTSLRNLSVEELIEYTPEEPVLAAVVICLMYALKSLSFFFPMAVLAALSGAVLPIYMAVPVNLTGIIIMATLPFLVGRYAEADLVDGLSEKYSKLDTVRNLGTNHTFVSAFFLRIISCMPYDAVSMVMGSMRMDYRKYILGSFLGTAPSIILTTFMGASVDDPTSPEFLICLGVNVFISLTSVIIYKVMSLRKSRKPELRH